MKKRPELQKQLDKIVKRKVDIEIELAELKVKELKIHRASLGCF